MLKKIAYHGVIALLISSVISCEKDFTDLNTNVITNSEFSINIDSFDVDVSPINIDRVRTDNITLGSNTNLRYLLGVYASDDYKKVEASFLSQITLASFRNTPTGDTIRVIDDAFISIPFQATKNSVVDNKPKFTLDSIIGNSPENVSIRVYRNGTYLNNFNPITPTETNKYYSDDTYQKEEELTRSTDFKLTTNPNDTVYVFDRYETATTFVKDTMKLSTVVPFLAIPLDNNKIKSILLDKAGSSELSTGDNLNNYFRGLIIEATGMSGSLVSFNVSTTSNLNIYYSDVVASNGVIDTIIRRNTSFSLAGIRTAQYKTMAAVNPAPQNSIALQGTAGSAGEVNVLTAAKIQELKTKNWLINDAALTFYVDASRDTSNAPKKLFLAKKNTALNGDVSYSQVKDAYTEPLFFGGNLELKDGKPEKYTFKITDYISDIVDPKSNEEIVPLQLKLYNTYTDSANKDNVLDTIVRSYNWNPNMISILNGDKTLNGNKRAQLKISYTEKK